MGKLLILFSFLLFQATLSQQVVFLKIKKYRVAELSDSLRENSGLHFYKNHLLTFNDGGNTSEIFQINPKTGAIEKKWMTNLKNVDWEAISSDSSHVYIGDCGNNDGTRKDLKIYKIPFENDDLKQDSIKIISFNYPQQTDLFSKPLNQNFDAESLIFLNNKLHLFTKEWASKKVSHYLVDPDKYDLQHAEKTEEFKINYFVTDAAFYESKLYLVGYTKKAEVFLSVFSEEGEKFFNQKPKTYYLGSALNIGQIEGIAVTGKGIFLSGEELKTPISHAQPSLYFVPFEKLK